MRLPASLFYLCLYLASGLSAHAIVNGQPVKDGDALSVGKILLTNQATQEIGACSGTFLTDTIFLTAGHCIDDGSAITLEAIQGEVLPAPIPAIASFTDYREGMPHDGIIPDLGLIQFPPHTALATSKTASAASLSIGAPLSFVGFGTIYNEFIDPMAEFDDPAKVRKNSAETSLAAVSERMLTIFAEEYKSFAGPGDSGAPIFSGDKVVAVIVTDARNDFGSRYGVINTATRLDSTESKSFFAKYLPPLGINVLP